MFSRASLFIKRLYNIFLLTFIMFKHFKVGKYLEHMRQKLSKNLPIFNFFYQDELFSFFFPSFFYPGIPFHPCLFDRDKYILGWNFIQAKTCKQSETFNNRRIISSCAPFMSDQILINQFLSINNMAVLFGNWSFL